MSARDPVRPYQVSRNWSGDDTIQGANVFPYPIGHDLEFVKQRSYSDLQRRRKGSAEPPCLDPPTAITRWSPSRTAAQPERIDKIDNPAHSRSEQPK